MFANTKQAQMSLSKKILRHHGRTFWLASFFLPRPQAAQATQLYGFCRLIDDLADEPSRPRGHVVHELINYFSVTGDIPKDLNQSESLLVCTVFNSDLNKSIILELLLGVESDLKSNIFTSESTLIRYSYAVAGTVGILMADIMKSRSEQAKYHAIDLGIAMQLTNISRDVLEDSQVDRRYIPMSAGVSEIRKGQNRKDVSAQISHVIDLSETYYRSGLEGLAYLPRKMRPCVYIMAVLYRAISRKLKKNNVNWHQGRTTITPIEKIYLILTALPTCFRLLVQTRSDRETMTSHKKDLHSHLSGLPCVHR